MILSSKQILFILDKINDGKFGYSEDLFVCALQGKLSIMLQMAHAEEQSANDKVSNE